ncbi:MAG: flagellar export chaperone FliS [bacterium]
MPGSYDAVDQYRKTAVNTASPLELVVMLYDGAIRFIDAGKIAMAKKDLEAQNTNLQKAQKVINELITCLDMQRGGEIATNLFSIYNFVNNQLIEANINDREDLLDGAKSLLINLREAWITIKDQLPASPSIGEKPRLELAG